MTPTPAPSAQDAAASEGPSLAAPEKNRRVVARMVGAKDHSDATWHREGWAFMTWWGDRWNDRLMADACRDLDADHLEVEAWFYPDEALRQSALLTAATVRAEKAERDLEEYAADKRRLAREIDVAMHGEANAALQASLCDLVPLAKMLRRQKNSAEARVDKAEAERDEAFAFGNAAQAEIADLRADLADAEAELARKDAEAAGLTDRHRAELREILSWHETGTLVGDALSERAREIAEKTSMDLGSAMRSAEDLSLREAAKILLALVEKGAPMSSRSEARKRGLVRIAQQRDAAEARAERLEGAIRLALATRVIEPYPAEILTAALAEKGDARDA